MDLTDRVCLITGGASGIGQATASRLLRHGAIVSVADISKTAIQKMQRNIDNRYNSRLHCHQFDVSDRTAVDSWMHCVDKEHDRIDVLIHCAASVDWNHIDDQSIETIERTMATGFNGMVYCTKLALPIMRRNSFGRIVYVSSIASTMQTSTSRARR